MKTLKKALATLLTLVMALCFAVPAFAANDGSITVNGTAGQTYTIYRIADLESHSGDAYSYKANDQWKTWLSSQSSYVSVDAQGYVTWTGNTTDATYAAFAQSALAKAKEEGSGISSIASGKIEDGKTAITFSGLAEGWYLVDSSQGALCILTTADKTATVTEKNSAPTVDKKVQENSTEQYGTTNDAAIGDTVNYQTTITVHKGAQGYVLTDTMSTGLTFNGVKSVTVKIGETTVADTNYTLTATDTTGFTLSLEDSYVAGLEDGTQIVVSYSATLNKNAVVASTENKNDVTLKYGDNSSVTSETTTYTWNLPIYKYTTKNSEKTPLQGAKFVLKKGTGSDVTYMVKNSETGAITWTATKSEATVLTSGSDGNVSVSGLDSGTYYLEETEAPTGYNKLPNDITVAISNQGALTENGSSANTIEVENSTGSVLPTTGGIGTTIFYVIGGILVAGAAITLIVRKRMTGYED